MEPSLFGLYPVKYAEIDTAAASGATTVVSGVAGSVIVVLDFWAVAGGATTVKFQTASTDITGPAPLAANGGVSANSNHGLMETADGEDLNINSSAAVALGGSLSYFFKRAAVGDGVNLV